MHDHPDPDALGLYPGKGALEIAQLIADETRQVSGTPPEPHRLHDRGDTVGAQRDGAFLETVLERTDRQMDALHVRDAAQRAAPFLAHVRRHRHAPELA